MKLHVLKYSLVLMVISICMSGMHVWANDTYGWVEEITVQPWEINVKAKLDTGALTSSMHAEDIERFKRDDEEWVRFTVNLMDEESGKEFFRRIERPMYRDFVAVGAGGKDLRPVVLMKVCIGNTIYEEQFSIRDRSDMLYPVLLGRRTIQHLGTVDVTRTFLQEPDCGADASVLSLSDQENDEDIGLD